MLPKFKIQARKRTQHLLLRLSDVGTNLLSSRAIAASRGMKMTVLLSLFLTINLLGQTQKGMWSAGGQFGFTQYAIDGVSGNSMMLEPDLGYVFHDRWMVWGQINISLVEKFSTVGHRLNLRYAFLKQPKLEGYAGLEYDRREQRFLINGNTNKREFIRFGPFGGFLFFLSPNSALDFSINYPLYRKFIFRNSVTKQNGDMSFSLGMKFYFNGKPEKDTTTIVPKLEKGQWLIGGNISLGRQSDLFRSNEGINLFTPFAGVLLSKHWMIGNRLFFTNTTDLVEWYFGLEPFSRYYFKPNSKRVFYGELGAIFYFRYLTENMLGGSNKGFASTEQTLTYGLGMNRWVAPNIALDFYFGGKGGMIRPRLVGDDFLSYQDFSFRLGLQIYL